MDRFPVLTYKFFSLLEIDEDNMLELLFYQMETFLVNEGTYS